MIFECIKGRFLFYLLALIDSFGLLIVGMCSFEKNHKLAPLSVTREASFGHGRLRVVNATTAHWAWHRNDDAQSVVRDELWLESLAANGACRQQGGHAAIDSSWKDEL